MRERGEGRKARREGAASNISRGMREEGLRVSACESGRKKRRKGGKEEG